MSPISARKLVTLQCNNYCNSWHSATTGCCFFETLIYSTVWTKCWSAAIQLRGMVSAYKTGVPMPSAILVPDTWLMGAWLITALPPHTHTVVVFSGGFSCGRRQQYQHLFMTIEVITKSFCFLAYLLLLNVHHGIMNSDENMLRVHVVH